MLIMNMVQCIHNFGKWDFKVYNTKGKKSQGRFFFKKKIIYLFIFMLFHIRDLKHCNNLQSPF